MTEAQSIIDTLDDLFVFLGASDVKFQKDHYSYPTAAISSTWPKDQYVAGSEGSPMLSGLFGNWAVSTVWMSNGLFHSVSGHDVHWSKVAKSLQSYRKRAQKFYPVGNASSADFNSYSYLNYCAVARSGKPVLVEERTYAYIGRKWFELGSNSFCEKGFVKPRADWILEGNELMISLAASEPAYWKAKVKLEQDVPGLALISDATGIKELLRVRDIPEGRQRRDALLHWVADHWRQSRHDPDVEIYVRKHLRGATQCTYKTYAIEVAPSREATVEAALAHRDRIWMREQRPRPDRRRRRA